MRSRVPLSEIADSGGGGGVAGSGEGVDQLVLQSAQGDIRALRHVEDFVGQPPLRAPRLAHHPPGEGPQPAQHPEQAALAGAIRSGD